MQSNDNQNYQHPSHFTSKSIDEDHYNLNTGKKKFFN